MVNNTNVFNISLRDHIAIHATNDDIEKYLNMSRQVQVLVDDPSMGVGGKRIDYKTIYMTRVEARYAFADEMLKVRGFSSEQT